MSTPEITTDFEVAVIGTLQHNGLDLDQCYGYGSLVLHRFGLRRAGDVDMILSPQYYAELGEAGETPGGLQLRKTCSVIKGESLRSIGQLAEEDLPLHFRLPSDPRFRPDTSPRQQRRDFRRLRRGAAMYPSTAGILLHDSLQQLRDHKAQEPSRPKDQADIVLIDAFLRARPD